jgi:CDP-diacylglycerol--glycerol-3-phosphate 3-phosphatidyltransferase
MIVYIAAGVTDMIDGPLARKLKITSKLGANLDGIADYILVVVALITIIPVLSFNPLLIALIVAGFAVLKISGMIVGYIHYKQLMMMHTYAAKMGAVFAFLFPVVLLFGVDENTAIIFLGGYVYLFLIEEMIINIIMPEPRRDIKGIFQAIQIRRKLKNELSD